VRVREQAREAARLIGRTPVLDRGGLQESTEGIGVRIVGEAFETLPRSRVGQRGEVEVVRRVERQDCGGRLDDLEHLAAFGEALDVGSLIQNLHDIIWSTGR
jgi:hypothetical protein